MPRSEKDENSASPRRPRPTFFLSSTIPTRCECSRMRSCPTRWRSSTRWPRRDRTSKLALLRPTRMGRSRRRHPIPGTEGTAASSRPMVTIRLFVAAITQTMPRCQSGSCLSFQAWEPRALPIRKACERRSTPSPTTTNLPGQPNVGFLRAQAQLVILFIGASADCSYVPAEQASFVAYDAANEPRNDTPYLQYLSPGLSCYVLANQLIAPQALAAQMTAIKPAALVSVSVIGGAVAAAGTLEPSSCFTGPDGHASSACACFEQRPLLFCPFAAISTPPIGQIRVCDDPACCTALANNRYFDFAQLFANRSENSICESDYSSALLALANTPANNCFAVPDSSGVQVTRRQAGEIAFDTLPATSWSRDNAGEVCLARAFAPQLGDTFRFFTLKASGAVR